MAQPVPSRPSAAPETESADAVAEETAGEEGATAEEEAGPLNRAERRAKARKAEPSHVGPRQEQERQVRGARARTKRSH